MHGNLLGCFSPVSTAGDLQTLAIESSRERPSGSTERLAPCPPAAVFCFYSPVALVRSLLLLPTPSAPSALSGLRWSKVDPKVKTVFTRI